MDATAVDCHEGSTGRVSKSEYSYTLSLVSAVYKVAVAIHIIPFILIL